MTATRTTATESSAKESQATGSRAKAQEQRSPIAGMQQSFGNRAVLGVLQRKCDCGGSCSSCGDEDLDVQTKLAVNTPGDAWEREADRVADSIMSAPAPAISRKTAPGPARAVAAPSGVAAG